MEDFSLEKVSVSILIVMEERIGSFSSNLGELTPRESLNPYCNGRKNRMFIILLTVMSIHSSVLILIVMEERIGFVLWVIQGSTTGEVLILIVMEERIGLQKVTEIAPKEVLILIVMEERIGSSYRFLGKLESL